MLDMLGASPAAFQSEHRRGLTGYESGLQINLSPLHSFTVLSRPYGAARYSSKLTF